MKAREMSIEARVRKERKAQGFGPTITDPGALARIATLVAAVAARPAKKSRRGSSSAA